MSFEEQLAQRLPERFPDAVEGTEVVQPRRVRADARREDLREICTYLRDEEGFEHLSCISAVDWVTHLSNVYHLVSYQNNTMLQLNVRIPSEDPAVDTVSDIWKGALYHEREAFDLMGIQFRDHPDLRRILLPEDFGFHPLRKDYEGE
ncbi:MAG: NADH-quinone oxidoreductase subunit C [Thermoplasmata archaeon]